MDIDPVQALTFKSRLTSGPLNAAQLVNKLETLHQELRSFDQGLIDKSSLDDVAGELVHRKILRHASDSVKALAACCLADILRLYAPDAPYNDAELKNIFQLFITQIRHLKQKDNPNYQHHFYLLESLSAVKSILIIGDLDNVEDLTTQLFTTFYDVGDAKVSRNVLVCMTMLMVMLVDEVGSLSEEVIELTLEQIQKHMDSPDSHNTMALELAGTCTDVMQRHVCQYFSDALIAMSKSDGSAEDEEELNKVHRLIQKVHSVIPDLLLNVVPQLEEEMKLDDYTIRLLATETVGGMLCEKRSTLHQRYPGVWKTWLGRRNDKSVHLRTKWIENAANIFQAHYFAVSTLNEYFKEKLLDPEEKVRAATCQAIGAMSLDHILNHVDESLLREIAVRCKDKKASVRKVAMSTLGSLYNAGFARIYENDDAAVTKLGWIPDSLFYCVYTDDAAVLAGLEKAVHDHIFPPMDDDEERTKRLVFVLESLDTRPKLGFIHIIRKQKSTSAVLCKLFKACKQSEDMDVDQAAMDAGQIETLVAHIAATFPDSSKVSDALQRLSDVLIENRDIQQLFETCVDPNSTYSDIQNSQTELVERLEEELPSVYEALLPVIRRASPTILNTTNIPHLLSIVTSQRPSRRASSAPKSKHVAVAQELLAEISQTFPTMFESYGYNLISSINHIKNEDIAKGTLELLSQVLISGAELDISDQAILDRFASIAQSQDAELARYASIVLCHMSAEDICAEIIETHCSNLTLSFATLTVSLTSLAQFALYMPLQVASHINDVAEFIFKKLMPYETKKERGKNAEWAAYEKLDASSKAKLAGLEVLINYLTGSVDLEPNDELNKEIFDTLFTFVNSTSDGAAADGICAAETSHLRLASVRGALKLTNMEAYENQLSVDRFEQIGLLLQDSCYHVREGFTESIMTGLRLGEIHHRYLSSLFLLAHEPEARLLRQVTYFIRKRADKLKSESAATETSFMQLIHILAHHPDFSISTEDLILFTRYLEFYISCIATRENVAYLYHAAQRIKQSRDMQASEQSENSYYLSDLATLLIKRKCKEASWPLNVYQQSIPLQSKLYKTLPSGAVQTETMKKNYLPASYLKWFEEQQDPKGGEKRQQATADATAKRTRTA